ncbi:hypothetical protein W97_03743 [Coniosporium apollinis CBS 100218]|uniref:Uncharacterized protein n=1 Tax=Coniosporium apollinis (strain CBS 100218) TaxID=1168221 RepID=R7YRH0_CONA1|nr:uncharacterized protein W97_03743 [Coniosporium apollinis CBS 100218]EON64510.1 hypothetical protein W97_03743 [Coniosporium apollinis CBS 100218]
MPHITLSGNDVDAARETSWLVIIESPDGRLFSTVLTFSPADMPETVVQKLRTLYKGRVSKKRRIFHRFILLHKPVVALATLSATAGPTLTPSPGQSVRVYDRHDSDILTRAFYKPDVLGNEDPAAFFAAYRRLAIDPGSHQAPEHALLIPLERDRVAVNCVRGVGMLISLAVGFGF